MRLKLCQPEESILIQVHGERFLSENRLERRRQSEQKKKARSKRRKASPEKRARKLDRTTT